MKIRPRQVKCAHVLASQMVVKRNALGMNMRKIAALHARFDKMRKIGLRFPLVTNPFI